MYSADSSDDPDQRATATQATPRPPPPIMSVSASERDGDQLFTTPFVRLLCMQSAYGFSFSMFFLLPKYLAAARATPTQIGFVMGGFGVACVLTIPFLPGIIRLFGRRGALMAATLALGAAGVAFAVIAPVGLGAVFLRASEGVTWTIMFSTGLVRRPRGAAHRLAQAIGLAGAAALIHERGRPRHRRADRRPLRISPGLLAGGGGGRGRCGAGPTSARRARPGRGAARWDDSCARHD